MNGDERFLRSGPPFVYGIELEVRSRDADAVMRAYDEFLKALAAAQCGYEGECRLLNAEVLDDAGTVSRTRRRNLGSDGDAARRRH